MKNLTHFTREERVKFYVKNVHQQYSYCFLVDTANNLYQFFSEFINNKIVVVKYLRNDWYKSIIRGESPLEKNVNKTYKMISLVIKVPLYHVGGSGSIPCSRTNNQGLKIIEEKMQMVKPSRLRG